MLPLQVSSEPVFEARCERREAAVVVVATGELDLGSADTLRSTLRGSEAQAAIVILDLRQLDFIDSSGLSVIVEQQQRARADSFRFVVAVGEARGIERVLALTGLRGTLEIVQDPDAVLVA